MKKVIIVLITLSGVIFAAQEPQKMNVAAVPRSIPSQPKTPWGQYCFYDEYDHTQGADYIEELRAQDRYDDEQSKKLQAVMKAKVVIDVHK